MQGIKKQTILQDHKYKKKIHFLKSITTKNVLQVEVVYSQK